MNQRQYQQWATRVVEEDIIEMALHESVETALFMHEEYRLWTPEITQLPFPREIYSRINSAIHSNDVYTNEKSLL